MAKARRFAAELVFAVPPLRTADGPAVAAHREHGVA
jgi:hypothetical protein